MNCTIPAVLLIVALCMVSRMFKKVGSQEDISLRDKLILVHTVIYVCYVVSIVARIIVD